MIPFFHLLIGIVLCHGVDDDKILSSEILSINRTIMISGPILREDTIFTLKTLNASQMSLLKLKLNFPSKISSIKAILPSIADGPSIISNEDGELVLSLPPSITELFDLHLSITFFDSFSPLPSWGLSVGENKRNLDGSSQVQFSIPKTLPIKGIKQMLQVVFSRDIQCHSHAVLPIPDDKYFNNGSILQLGHFFYDPESSPPQIIKIDVSSKNVPFIIINSLKRLIEWQAPFLGRGPKNGKFVFQDDYEIEYLGGHSLQPPYDAFERVFLNDVLRRKRNPFDNTGILSQIPVLLRIGRIGDLKVWDDLGMITTPFQKNLSTVKGEQMEIISITPRNPLLNEGWKAKFSISYEFPCESFLISGRYGGTKEFRMPSFILPFDIGIREMDLEMKVPQECKVREIEWMESDYGSSFWIKKDPEAKATFKKGRAFLNLGLTTTIKLPKVQMLTREIVEKEMMIEFLIPSSLGYQSILYLSLIIIPFTLIFFIRILRRGGKVCNGKKK